MPDSRANSRYTVVSRRAMLRRSLGVGAALTLPGLVAACGGSAIDVAGAPSSTADPAPTDPTGTPTDATAIPSPTEPTATQATEPTAATAATETAPIEAPTAEVAAASTTAFPSGSELVVDFTYTMGDGGKRVPPYVAVWIEDDAGELVETIELWYQLDKKGPRWLPDLKRWFRKEEAFVALGNADETDIISTATRLPGAYSIVWDGIVNGEALPAGAYYICIEAARERGPYSLIRQPRTLAGEAFSARLPDDAELSGASITVTA